MKPDKPDDGLESKNAANADERPEVYAIQRGQSGWTLSRRSLLSAAAAAAAIPKRAQAAACATGAEAHQDWVLSVAISPDGRLLASGSYDRTIKLWSLPDGALLKTLTVPYQPINSVAISPDGRLLASGIAASGSGGAGSVDGSVKLWSLPDGALLKTLNGLSPMYPSLAISPDGRLLAWGNTSSAVVLWSLPDGGVLKTLTGHSDFVLSVAFSPDGRLLASSSMDKTIKLWSLPDGALLKTLTGHTGYVESVAISLDGRLLASGSDDRTIKLWSLPDGKLLPVCLMDPAASPSSVSGATYAKDGVTYSVACGSPMPTGAVCTCNCVPGTGCSCVFESSGCQVVYYYPN